MMAGALVPVPAPVPAPGTAADSSISAAPGAGDGGAVLELDFSSTPAVGAGTSRTTCRSQIDEVLVARDAIAGSFVHTTKVASATDPAAAAPALRLS